MLRLYQDSSMPLRDSVYRTLRDAILKGELKPGARLMEMHLASEIGVSRTPVREAIRLLEKEGLAVTFPRKGAQVMRMTVKDLEDVLEIRNALDTMAARKACDNINDEVIKMLEKEMDIFEKAIETDEFRDIVESDERFHFIIYDAANNPRLTEIVTTLREQMYRFRYEYIKGKSALKQLFEEHMEILNALKNRDKDTVSDIMAMHLSNQYEWVKNLIIARDNS